MIALDEDALICDMAETYHIYAMRQMNPLYIATLAMGLRHDSRIKLKAAGLSADINTLLLAHVADNTAINWWLKTKDAQTGKNQPRSVVKSIFPEMDDSSNARQFETGEDFLAEWRRINGN